MISGVGRYMHVIKKWVTDIQWVSGMVPVLGTVQVAIPQVAGIGRVVG